VKSKLRFLRKLFLKGFCKLKIGHFQMLLIAIYGVQKPPLESIESVRQNFSYYVVSSLRALKNGESLQVILSLS